MLCERYTTRYTDFDDYPTVQLANPRVCRSIRLPLVIRVSKIQAVLTMPEPHVWEEEDEPAGTAACFKSDDGMHVPYFPPWAVEGRNPSPACI